MLRSTPQGAAQCLQDGSVTRSREAAGTHIQQLFNHVLQGDEPNGSQALRAAAAISSHGRRRAGRVSGRNLGSRYWLAAASRRSAAAVCALGVGRLRCCRCLIGCNLHNHVAAAGTAAAAAPVALPLLPPAAEPCLQALAAAARSDFLLLLRRGRERRASSSSTGAAGAAAALDACPAAAAAVRGAAICGAHPAPRMLQLLHIRVCRRQQQRHVTVAALQQHAVRARRQRQGQA